MRSEEGCGIGAEFPHSHLLEILFIVFFASVWGIDVLFLQLYLPLGVLVLDLLRSGISVSLLLISILIIKKSWLVVTPEVYDSQRLLKKGLYNHVRHPMYMGILLIYFSFVVLTLSLTLMLAWLIIFSVFDMMVNYEEEKLVEIFGEEYKEYRKQVSKWIPFKR
ncbi:MAG: isoprenylcysteine carboxylmethyltransferase family protein [Promethearchaeia archaeon]